MRDKKSLGVQGKQTREQQHRIIEKRENTKNSDQDLSPAFRDQERTTEGLEQEPVNSLPEISSGDRSIKRGAHQESDHNKHRADED